MTTEDRRAGIDWPNQAVEQLDWHWRTQLRPRLDGLTDAEYLWEPTSGAWNVHLAQDGGAATIDFAYPEPRPAPLTTIAWQLAHVIVGCLGARTASHFGGPSVDYDTFPYAATADAALVQLDEAYRGWLAGVRGWQADGSMGVLVGPAEGSWADYPRGALVLHINREVIHHGAHVAVLRDLWAHRND
jgi:hypothetical protein